MLLCVFVCMFTLWAGLCLSHVDTHPLGLNTTHSMMQSVRHTHKHTVKHTNCSRAELCVCVFVWAALRRANLDDVSPLYFTDLFVYWCFKCCCSHTAAQMGKHIDVFTREFFMMMKIFGYVLKVFSPFSLLFSPSVSFSTQQQSREWLSHPCKGVSAWLCGCGCACVCVCATVCEMNQAHSRRSWRRISVRVRLRSGMEAAVPIWRNKPNSGPF